MATNEPALLTNNPMVDNFYDNTQSNVIRITDDKLKVILLENKESLKRNNDVIAPLTLLISLILTFCTTDFKDFLTIGAPVWKALYLFLALASVIWLVYELNRIRKTITIDELIDQIRRQRPSPTVMKRDNSITIHSATYGVDGTFVDVTSKVKELVMENIREIPSSNELGGDPIYGKRKILEINFSIDGNKRTRTAIEGSILKLDE